MQSKDENVKTDGKDKTPDLAHTQDETITHEVGKVKFVVTPVYKRNTDKKICDLLLDLMRKDSEKVVK